MWPTMIRLKNVLVILLTIISGSALLFGALKPDILAIIDYYNNGNTSKCAAILQTAVPENQEESAAILYYKAMLSGDAVTCKANLLSIVSTYAKTQYAQKAMLELGNLSLLDREYDKALGYYRNITDPALVEKHYWIANTYFQMSDYPNAIASGNQYIHLSKFSPRVEDIYYLVADAYFSSFQYNNTISTLKKLLAQPDSLDDEQYLRYRYGYACEMLGNKQEALSQYKQGLEFDRFSSLAYLIEDRLFEMRGRTGSSLDLSFLYPFSESPLPDIVVEEQLKEELEAEQEAQDSTTVVKDNSPKQLEAVPDKGLYLQAGRFSKEMNAVKLCDQILKLKLNAQYYKSVQFKDVSWVVVIGPYQTQEEAQAAKDALKDNLIDSFIIER
jgi:hypothetical protein